MRCSYCGDHRATYRGGFGTPVCDRYECGEMDYRMWCDTYRPALVLEQYREAAPEVCDPSAADAEERAA